MGKCANLKIGTLIKQDVADLLIIFSKIFARITDICTLFNVPIKNLHIFTLANQHIFKSAHFFYLLI
jgi:hypothetical protein